MDTQKLQQVVGYCDLVSATSIEGWAFITGASEAPLVIQVLLDGCPFCWAACDLPRADVAAAGYPNPLVGFHVALPPDLDDGDHVIEFRGSDGTPIVLQDRSGARESWLLSKTDLTPSPPRLIVANLDAVTELGASGWAYDDENPDIPITLDIFIDGVYDSTALCDLQRDDVKAAGHPSARVGFYAELAPRYFDGQPHVLEIRRRHGDPRHLQTWPGAGHERLPFIFPRQVVIGQVDGLQNGAVRGWVFSKDRVTGSATGGVQVLVTLQGHPIAQLRARDFRADVAAAHGCEPNCGFSFMPPLALVAGRTVELQFSVIPGGYVLTGSPARITFPSSETVAAIRDLQEATEKAFAELWLLRDRLRKLTPVETYTLDSYDAWARHYQKALGAMPDQLQGLRPADGSALPLVSVVCPVYRPRLSDFNAAVQSVCAQSYPNWELIIVDDASGSAELADCIAAMARQEPRIKALTLPSNEGISGATNAAIAQAIGRYVALFDHDDLLSERALEFMLAAALRTGALLLYSDEDKIDDDGMFSEVHFKPDWNQRLLLSQNYICHLLLVERSQLDAVGPFRTACDGAQDHDIVLRLSEIVPPERIVHVPEVLYHWRKTPSSTAYSGGVKTYTVAAGIRAVQDHLDRQALAGRVHARDGMTCYEIAWKLTREPAVNIIIPYHEHVDTTRACLKAIRDNTDYENYDILLIDNWSVSDEALEFAAEVGAGERVSVMRIEESFNYSRLNNLGVARSHAELLLFLNNDVVVTDPAWLRVMVGELLADPRVGIVGNKLIYPNGLVQHGGVILGVGGVGEHAHKGLAKDDPGYAMRAICAQDMSAVTAACMLCRRSTFDAIGGFDEQDLRIAFNDVDLCLKAGQGGFRVIWTPFSLAKHHESLSRSSDLRPDQQARFFHENEIMMQRWRSVIDNDPHYNRNFSRQSEIFVALAPPASFQQASIAKGAGYARRRSGAQRTARG